ncbi:MAG TPA: NADH-quinone oxidoreductase subunit C [candidate division Zixibacteria bacterium]|nr:NADH-quinone oxidoreductase subunit C [candidate division Zixibacteria bacterium]
MEEKLRDFFETNYKEALIREDNFRDQQSFYIKREYLFDICRALLNNSEFEFKFLSEITSIDWLGRPEESNGRFEVIYVLFSLKHKYRFLIKVPLPGDNPVVDSLTPLWHTADWLEREVWDLMGIEFTGHPNLVKILTPDDLEGHPLRKDFPLTYEIPQFSHNKEEPPEVIL